MSDSTRPSWQLWLLVAIPTALVYANSLGNPFHYDDAHSIVENEHIRDLGNIPRFFVDPTTFASQPQFAMYRPLLVTTFALNYALGEYDVTGYHVAAILLHVGCALFVFGIASRLLLSRRGAVIAALVFGLHPVATEPVNYISSRSELLVALFVLAGFRMFLQRRWYPTDRTAEERSTSAAPRRRFADDRSSTFALILLVYTAALLTKATGVALPALMLAYDAVFDRRVLRAELRLYGAMASMTLLYLWMILSPFHRATVGAPVRTYAEQLWSQAKALVLYLQLFVVPTRLSVDHQFLISDSLIDPFAAASVLLLATALVLGIRLRRHRRLYLFLLLWFLIALAPASLVPLNVLVNEHRLYIPLAAFAIAAGWGLARLLAAHTASLGRGVGVVVIAGLMLSCASMTSARNQVWGAAHTLWADAARQAPMMARPHFYLAESHAAAGEHGRAIEAYRAGLARDSTFTEGYVRLAELYGENADFGSAEAAYLRAVETDPENGEIWGLLGAHYRARAMVDSAAAAWWHRSLEAYERAVAHSGQDRALLNNLGNTYQELGRVREALRAHQRAAQIAPGDPQTLLNLGNDHRLLGDLDAAAQAYTAATTAAPDYVLAWLSLALVHEATGDAAAALEAYARAARLDSRYAEAVQQKRRQLREGAHEQAHE